MGAGTLLMEIDSRIPQAQIASLESVRAQREIDVNYARQEAERSTKLLKAGAATKRPNGSYVVELGIGKKALKAARAR